VHQSKWPEAEPPLRECLTIREKALPDDWATSYARSLLGGALLGEQKFNDAEPLLLQAYEGMKQRQKMSPPQGKARMIEAGERLVRQYEATNKKDEAAKWRKDLDAIKSSEEAATPKR
jgi:eukaryotic-like serine/threonine-protein kinase